MVAAYIVTGILAVVSETYVVVAKFRGVFTPRRR